MLNFKKHVTNLCNKVRKKIQGLTRVFPFMPVTQINFLVVAYFLTHFEFCPLVWMKHDIVINNRTNGFYKTALRLVYSDFTSTFSELLIKDKFLTKYQRILQTLLNEVFKVKNNLAPEISSNIFSFKTVSYKQHFTVEILI